MKKHFLFFSFIFLFADFRGQDTIAADSSAGYAIVADSVKLNELSVSFAPAIMMLMGGNNFSPRTNFNIAFRRQLRNNWILRTALVIFPTPGGTGEYSLEYDRTVNNVNVFRQRQSGGGVKSQANLGIEKIFKVNRLIHGVGAEIFANQQDKNYQENYFWRPFTSPSNPVPIYDSLNYAVDSLGFRYSGKQIGGGFQFFYSLRYKISDSWYFSATIGPSVNFSIFEGVWYDRPTRKETAFRNFNMDFPNAPFISDVSVSFRF